MERLGSFGLWFLAIFCGASVLLFADTRPASAGKTIWEDGGSSLSLSGDARFRLEQDEDKRAGKDDRDRTRTRVRLRAGGDYVANETLSMGFRLATGSASLQSPHQTLGFFGKSGGNADFGLDRVFIKLKSGGAFIWGGKNGFPAWNPAEFIWDDDVQPEGVAAGYNGSLGALKFGIGLGFFTISEGNWDDDDTLASYQVYFAGGEDLSFKIALGGLSFTDGDSGEADKASGQLPGGSSTIGHVVAEARAKDVPLSPRVGFGYSSSDTGDSDIGSGVESDDKTSWVAYVRGNIDKLDLRFYYWDNGYAGQPLLGNLGQDNFPFSSNFTGYHAQVGYKFLENLSVDLRYYFQETKNENLTVFDSDIAMQGNRERTRIQLNFNMKF